MKKALRHALLLPNARLKKVEHELDFTAGFMLTEELKDLPYGLIWTEFCKRNIVPRGAHLIDTLERYQHGVTGRG